MRRHANRDGDVEELLRVGRLMAALKARHCAAQHPAEVLGHVGLVPGGVRKGRLLLVVVVVTMVHGGRGGAAVCSGAGRGEEDSKDNDDDNDSNHDGCDDAKIILFV